MARRKKKKTRIRQKEQKDFIVQKKKPENFVAVGSSIWWEANPDKSKEYGKKEFEQKEKLTPKEAEIFLGVTREWLLCFMAGKKGFPKLPYSWGGNNVATVKLARDDLGPYRIMLQGGSSTPRHVLRENNPTDIPGLHNKQRRKDCRRPDRNF